MNLLLLGLNNETQNQPTEIGDSTVKETTSLRSYTNENMKTKHETEGFAGEITETS